jgi:hypothetical protein
MKIKAAFSRQHCVLAGDRWLLPACDGLHRPGRSLCRCGQNGVEIVDIERTEIDLQRFEDIRQTDALTSWLWYDRWQRRVVGALTSKLVISPATCPDSVALVIRILGLLNQSIQSGAAADPQFAF